MTLAVWGMHQVEGPYSAQKDVNLKLILKIFQVQSQSWSTHPDALFSVLSRFLKLDTFKLITYTCYNAQLMTAGKIYLPWESSGIVSTSIVRLALAVLGHLCVKVFGLSKRSASAFPLFKKLVK